MSDRYPEFSRRRGAHEPARAVSIAARRAAGFGWLMLIAVPLFVLARTSVADEISVLDTYPGRMVSIGGHALHIDCRGSGHPVTVFESGLGGFSLEWGEVQQRLSQQGRVCAYDRAGYGWSDPGPMPRSVMRNVEELHALLAAAGESPPFVLVGHSYGGIIVRLFAQNYSDEVEGIVLLDASAPDQFSRLPDTALPKALIEAARRGTHTVSIPRLVAALPEEIQTTATHLMMLPKARLAYASEMRYFESATEQLKEQNDGALDVRLVVVSRSRNVFGRSAEAAHTELIWQEMQQRMAALSGRSDHWMAAGAGHVIHADRPDLVALAVREAAAYDPADTHWPTDSPVRLVLDAPAFVYSVWDEGTLESPRL